MNVLEKFPKLVKLKVRNKMLKFYSLQYFVGNFMHFPEEMNVEMEWDLVLL